MAVGRKPQVEEQASGGEVLGIVTIAVAVFLTLAFYSYRSGNADQNQVGLIGHLLADLLCPAFGLACYLIPLGQFYFAGVLLRLWACPAPMSQMFAGTVFLFSSAAFLALWGEAASDRQGWRLDWRVFGVSPSHWAESARCLCVSRPGACDLVSECHTALAA